MSNINGNKTSPGWQHRKKRFIARVLNNLYVNNDSYLQPTPNSQVRMQLWLTGPGDQLPTLVSNFIAVTFRGQRVSDFKFATQLNDQPTNKFYLHCNQVKFWGTFACVFKLKKNSTIFMNI